MLRAPNGGYAAVVLSGSFGGAPASSADIRNATLITNGAYVYGININAENTSAVIENVSIDVQGSTGATGVWLPSVGTSLTARRHITSSNLGIDARAGTVTLEDGSVTTQRTNGYGLYVSREYGSTATIKAKKVKIETFGVGGVGALARASGAEIRLADSSVTTHGDGA